jgi:hypothetical protein
MTLCGSRCDPGGASPRWRSESQIADGRLQIWNLTFGIGHPEGHAFVPQGLRLDRLAPRIIRAKTWVAALSHGIFAPREFGFGVGKR